MSPVAAGASSGRGPRIGMRLLARRPRSLPLRRGTGGQPQAPDGGSPCSASDPRISRGISGTAPGRTPSVGKAGRAEALAGAGYHNASGDVGSTPSALRVVTAGHPPLQESEAPAGCPCGTARAPSPVVL
ncbi:hypothetical protein CGC21_37165 [Leishmania donovani]|uniref:Uncharacterized protein n=1 Tax=Leishmania donovani TaxID=5661 RepID=A0A504XYE4_LEIDO|nr:hypothetical protein CGC21_37100 [Leishmania donovani]TPP53573.1 hypothetical protein CGC21_37120 [Leishmania donovani]TPP53582.1 hypothetical protein CGC21_37165 [Leishmania donovani]